MQSTAPRHGFSAPGGDRTDVASRWKPLWLATYFVGLGFASVCAFEPNERIHGTPITVVLAIAIGGATWHWLLAIRRPHAHRETKPMLGWATVAVVLTTALVWMAPVYLFAASFMYAQIFVLMPWRSASITAMIFTAALFVPAQAALGPTFATIMACAGFGACLLSGFVSAVIDQNRARQQTIRDLRTAESTIAAFERNAGRLEERARIARELHDSVAQDLVGLTMQLEALEKQLPQADVARLRALSRGALADARQLIEAHRPRQLAGSFAGALESLGGGEDTPRIEVTVDADVIIDGEHEAILFRVAQEAVANARKHADASTVAITVSAAGRHVCLDVVDDGVGFDPSSVREGGFGLESMQARVRAARGTLSIESQRGEGTTVHVDLPRPE